MGSSHVVAFCPGQISGYFLPVISENPDESGSCGAGLVISEGVKVTASRNPVSSVDVYQTDRTGMPNKIAESSNIIMNLLDALDVSASITTCCHLPIGCGYGMSAAALLGATHALNRLFQFGMNEHECARLAHRLEVMERSGLGDVSGCQGGGFVVRVTPGPDGEIYRTMDTRSIFAITISPIKTSSVLSSPEQIEKFKRAYPTTIPKTLDEFMTVARKFAEGTGLITEDVRNILLKCDAHGIPASMTMLGNGVFATGRDAEKILSGFGDVYRLSLSPGGPRILHGEYLL